MTFDGAVIKEQGVTFAIVLVKSSVINSANRENIRSSFVSVFGSIPIILAAQRSDGRLQYHGNSKIVNFLSKIDHRRIPWKKYTVN